MWIPAVDLENSTVRESGWSNQDSPSPSAAGASAPSVTAGARTASEGTPPVAAGATNTVYDTPPPASPAPSSRSDSGQEEAVVDPGSDADAAGSRSAAASSSKRGDGGEEGDRIVPPSALKAKQRSTKESASARFIQMADASERMSREVSSARMLTARANADYQQKRVQIKEQFLVLAQAKMDTNKIVELAKANVSPEDYTRWKVILSGGGGTANGSSSRPEN